MGTAAKVGLAAGIAVLAAGGVVAWKSSTVPDVAPPRPAPAPAAVPVPREPGPRDLPPPAPLPAPAAPGPAPVAPGPKGPAIDERLDERPAEMVFEGRTVGSVIQDLAVRLGLEAEYETDVLRQDCFATPFTVRFRAVPIRDVLTAAVRAVPSPVEGRVLCWEVRMDRLRIIVNDPPPPRRETAEEAKAREGKENPLLDRIRAEKTSFSFDGQNLMEVCSYFSARHGVNIVTEHRIHERAGALRVKLALTDVTLAGALDEIVRLDPDLAWEVRGTLVLIRMR